MSVDELVKEFDINEIANSQLKEKIVSLRMPEDYKMKFDIIQARSNRRFAEHARSVLICEIDKVWPELEKLLQHPTAG